MKHSLLSRFRGLLLGAVLGEACFRHPWPMAARSVLGQKLPFGDLPLASVCLSHTIATSTTTLIQQQLNPTAKSLTPSPATTESEMLVALLPVILYFHEKNSRLQQQIQQHLPTAASPELEVAAMVVAEAIAQILQEKCSPNTFIPQLLAAISLPETSLTRQLELVQDLIQARASLLRTVQALMLADAPDKIDVGRAIALAFYCWLSTPESWLLSLQRVQRIPNQTPLITVMTGAFSGAYNGQFRVLSPWQQQHLFAYWEDSFPSQTQIVSLADQLMAVWSGCLQPLSLSTDQPHIRDVAISAAGRMRPYPKVNA